LKIFEAMAMGKAVVSTRIGAEGLPVEDGEHLLLADAPEEFADAVIRLHRDEALRRRLGCAARRLVEERYGNPAVAKTCHDILAQVAKAGRRENGDGR
jgi:glycosyltransferase involved in cell wall biosynthesis